MAEDWRGCCPGRASSSCLSVAGLPASYTWSFSQDPVLAATTQVTLSIRASSTKGTFTVTVTGVGGALTRTAQAQLKVNGK
jgi:hypothetical protein